ncbi:MAG: DUF2868 domain-containing protein [Desulfobacter sp.]|nr:MAG: DUF2868 domain-containing protein [Desulfobacter sp.]
MNFSLKEIIDLDFFLSLDEGMEDRKETAARDREIFREIEGAGPGSGIDNKIDIKDDRSLLLAWLKRRRQMADRGDGRLPGSLYHSLYRWTLRIMAVLGLAAGFITAYSFLAYHGSRPVNVTLFIAFFILFQALLALAAGIVMARRIRPGGSNGSRYSFFHTLIFEAFLGRLRSVIEKAGDLPGSAVFKDAGASGLVSRFRSGTYKGLLFWPVFTASSLAALGFSLGCLGGTLFRVMVTDLAFGWQSTLFTSGEQIHKMVSALALPWSWILPDGAALPTLAQVHGSRIILKQGMSGLATEHLAAWWPFLCMGILVYGGIPRLALLGGAVGAGKKALNAFDMNRPRYRRLLMRMRSPRMNMEIRETGGTRAHTRPPLPDPALARGAAIETAPVLPPTDPGGGGPQEVTEPRTAEPQAAEPEIRQKTPALVLASARSYPDGAMDDIAGALDRQLGVDIAGIARIGFEFEGDEPALKAAAPPENGVVILLQEVWQPPIRGLLYYLTQLRKAVFPDHDIWIFLTRTPGEGAMAVAAGDMDFQVWQTAVAQLKDPGIIVERWMP